MDILNTRSGINQNDASKYTIIDLTEDEISVKQDTSEEHENLCEYEDEPCFESTNEPACGSADGSIITKLNLLFNYINNSNFENLKILNFESIEVHTENRRGIIDALKRLKCYVDDENALTLMPEDKIFDFKIIYWVVKELYESPYRLLLHKLNSDNLKHRLLKAKKYMDYSDLNGFIKYFMKCLQKELEVA